MAGKKRVDEGAKVRGCLCGDIDPSDRPCLVCEAAGEQAKVRGHVRVVAVHVEGDSAMVSGLLESIFGTTFVDEATPVVGTQAKAAAELGAANAKRLGKKGGAT